VTRKDYVLIASAVERVALDAREIMKGLPIGDVWDHAVIAVATELADALAADNPRFERERFLKACGVI
jgi:hypothetical protein